MNAQDLANLSSRLIARVPEVKRDKPDPTAVQVAAARLRLIEGNAAFVSERQPYPEVDIVRRTSLERDQNPIAAIICCSDSRVPPEIVFWQGLGNLFVVREAGNVVDFNGSGSILYAVSVLKVPLIVVMGHESCGAVAGAIAWKKANPGATRPYEVARPGTPPVTDPLDNLIRQLVPEVDKHPTISDDVVLMERVACGHAAAMVAALRAAEPFKSRIAGGMLDVVAAYYDLGGTVRYL